MQSSGLASARGDFVMGTTDAGSEGTAGAGLAHDALDLGGAEGCTDLGGLRPAWSLDYHASRHGGAFEHGRRAS